jgi:hypothetical protein
MDLYLGRGLAAQWLGSIAGDARPGVLLTVAPGRRPHRHHRDSLQHGSMPGELDLSARSLVAGAQYLSVTGYGGIGIGCRSSYWHHVTRSGGKIDGASAYRWVRVLDDGVQELLREGISVIYQRPRGASSNIRISVSQSRCRQARHEIGSGGEPFEGLRGCPTDLDIERHGE